MKKEIETKTNVIFVDKNRERFNCEIEITYRNKYKEFTMHSESGQGKFVPANEPQAKLLHLWDTYHLNGMHAGTPEQESLINSEKFETFKTSYLKIRVAKKQVLEKAEQVLEKYYEKCKKNKAISRFEETRLKKLVKSAQKDFDFVKDDSHHFVVNNFLLKEDKYIVPHPKTGKPYTYGSEWLRQELPKDIEEQIETIVQEIVEAEEERKGKPLSELTDDDLHFLINEQLPDLNERDTELCMALVRMFDLSEDDLQDISIDGNRSTVQGIDYYAGTDEEMDEEWEADLKNYLEECVLPELPETTRKYFDEESWIEDAKGDGRGHSLNRYNGGEEHVKIGKTDYYAYRQ